MKKIIRNLAKTILSSKKPSYKDRKICDFLYALIKTRGFKHILLFFPLPHEVNIFPLLKKLKQERYVIFVPKIVGERMQITPLRLPFVKKEFQILHSSSSAGYPIHLDLAVIPILGFDCEMRRIGFGKGFYDRFFNENFEKPYIIFLSQTLIFSKDRITHWYDIQADQVISRRIRIKTRRGNGMDRNKPYYFYRCGSRWIFSDAQKAFKI